MALEDKIYRKGTIIIYIGIYRPSGYKRPGQHPAFRRQPGM
jgi:hypothetical protein